jgi:hypothetical protein
MSSVVFELTALEVNATFTGSMLSNGGTLGVGQNAFQFGTNSLSTGSWFGLDNTWGVSTTIVDAISGSMTASLKPGIWASAQQPDHSWGVLNLVTESHDRFDVTSDQFPEVDQGVGPGEWNPFPIPPEEVPPELPQRDTTRFRKSYSSQRHQPKRIRLVKN